MREARIFKAWKKKLVGDLTNIDDPIVASSLRMFKDVTTTLEQTLLIAFLHDSGLRPGQIEMCYSHSPEGMLVCARERVERSNAVVVDDATQVELEATGKA